ncbi:hypothetical protein P152DRAFT_161950 [Eremomyces bilateralis CBS 781.70]|uniref:Uncharacterized protein n=1 Tax=Eremomyces bilateralis CBS 781.70 TaxID=1392243 RepID=A0A6G1FUK5_9PEZI|nr:uncharacterized protein P152DRAFT_161950 [Eremomyces bilateralis CBS 781.70]KAF1809372.1 hypothetical protein P152DRAFT_161950 [Eremomyces bilateralis CBS 781.70]
MFIQVHCTVEPLVGCELPRSANTTSIPTSSVNTTKMSSTTQTSVEFSSPPSVVAVNGDMEIVPLQPVSIFSTAPGFTFVDPSGNPKLTVPPSVIFVTTLVDDLRTTSSIISSQPSASTTSSTEPESRTPVVDSSRSSSSSSSFSSSFAARESSGISTTPTQLRTSVSATVPSASSPPSRSQSAFHQPPVRDSTGSSDKSAASSPSGRSPTGSAASSAPTSPIPKSSPQAPQILSPSQVGQPLLSSSANARPTQSPSRSSQLSLAKPAPFTSLPGVEYVTTTMFTTVSALAPNSTSEPSAPLAVSSSAVSSLPLFSLPDVVYETTTLYTTVSALAPNSTSALTPSFSLLDVVYETTTLYTTIRTPRPSPSQPSSNSTVIQPDAKSTPHQRVPLASTSISSQPQLTEIPTGFRTFTLPQPTVDIVPPALVIRPIPSEELQRPPVASSV